MMPLKPVTDSVFPNANWISDVLNAASNTDTNWVWGCRILCKKKFHNQEAKDFLQKIVFFELHWPHDIVTKKRSRPLLSKDQTFVNTFANCKEPLAQEKRSLIPCLSPKGDLISGGLN